MTSVDAAWQGALAAEHQAVFGYALLGPRLSVTDRPLAVTCSNAHENLRDTTEAALVAAGRAPVAAQPDYPALYPVTGPAGARALAVRLEDACAAAWRYLYAAAAQTPGATTRRAEAQDALTASAVRATRWRALIDPSRATDAFPGL